MTALTEGTPELGLVEWFRPGEYDRVETALADARLLGIKSIRTGVSWAEWHAREGDGWYAWLLPRLAREVQVLPCVMYTPPSLGLVPKFSSPPATPKTYADFIDVLITRLGHCFDWIELWNRPDDLQEWDARLDPDWRIFSEMIGGAAYWIRSRGKKTVLPALSPTRLDWLSLMHGRGVLSYIDAVGIHGHPGATETPWQGWDAEVGAVHRHLAKLLEQPPEIWVTQTGFSTWRGDERSQIHAFIQAMAAPVQRLYWYAARDTRPESAMDPYRSDERDYHYGMRRADGRPKLLFELWTGNGLAALRKAEIAKPAPRIHGRRKHVLITGGAGFIGTNLAHRLLEAGKPVLIYDNLSRPGSERSLEWLRDKFPKGLIVETADVRDAKTLRPAVRNAEQVFHFAAQVAVTTSLVDPRTDFDVNVGGTFHLLEALRSMERPASLLYTSTNKVYGSLADVELVQSGKRYQPVDPDLRGGIDERRSLDFHSPYGCSKGAADQYVLDYSRTYGIPAAVFRMSCIYGLHQNGTEDQGWVAHFLLQALRQHPITLYGDGMQVRDLLFAEDLIDAFLLAQSNIATLAGQAYNIGGGLGNTVSLLDLVDLIEELNGARPHIKNGAWRPGDQRYYVSDTRKFRMATGWAPKVNVHHGVRQLNDWLRNSSTGNIIPRRPQYGVSHAVFTH